MGKNTKLTSAKRAKNDEFYTRLADVERELYYYRPHFRDKIVLLNCDDPETSAFWRYFEMNFDFLGLKKLISTHYHPTEQTYKLELTRGNDLNGDGKVDGIDKIKTQLEGNGDFRNAECLELLDEADIVVTNPPFSIWREFLGVLVEHEKEFLILGNNNAITYKEVFPLLKGNKMWLGTISNKTLDFVVPDDYFIGKSGYVDGKGHKHAKVPAISWFTNLDIPRLHKPLTLWKEYTPEAYPKYDNYDAINVDKVAEIPCDYYGEMGVPITFMGSYCPEQFEIVNANDFRRNNEVPVKQHGLIKDKEATITVEREREGQPTPASSSVELLSPGSDGWHINGKRKYARIFIRRIPRHGCQAGN